MYQNQFICKGHREPAAFCLFQRERENRAIERLKKPVDRNEVKNRQAKGRGRLARLRNQLISGKNN